MVLFLAPQGAPVSPEEKLLGAHLDASASSVVGVQVTRQVEDSKRNAGGTRTMTTDRIEQLRKKKLEKKRKLERELNELENKKRRIERKERNGQLIALGVYLETKMKKGKTDLDRFVEDAQKYVAGKEYERILAAISRIHPDWKKPEKTADEDDKPLPPNFIHINDDEL